MKLVSVITICRNAEAFIEETMKSVVSQDFDSFEYVVIDGNSSDRTLEIIKTYSKNVTHFISEPDLGIYDAMNKGANLALGEYVIFLNAGDRFLTPKTLSQASHKLKGYDYVYGDVIVDFGHNLQVLRKSKESVDIFSGMPCSHQSLFVHREQIQKNKFDLTYRIASDYHQLLCGVKDGSKIDRIDQTISLVTAGGVSDVRRSECVKEYIRAVKESRNGNPVRLAKLYVLLLRSRFSESLLKVLPQKLLHQIRSIKYSQ